MKIIVAGSRICQRADLVDEVLSRTFSPDDCLLHGGARGVDQLAKHWAWTQGFASVEYLADWERYGQAAGPIRNRQMVEAGELLLAFWDGQSPGTADMLRQMHCIRKPWQIIPL